MKSLISLVALGVILLTASIAWAGVFLTPPIHRGGGDLSCIVLNAGTRDDPEVTMEIRNNDNVVVGGSTNNIPAGGIETVGTSSPNPNGGSFYCRVSGIGKAKVTLCVLDATTGTPIACVTAP